jgi:hypothetical protein
MHHRPELAFDSHRTRRGEVKIYGSRIYAPLGPEHSNLYYPRSGGGCGNFKNFWVELERLVRGRRRISYPSGCESLSQTACAANNSE